MIIPTLGNNSSEKLFKLLLLLSLLSNLYTCQELQKSDIKRNILVVPFPGGKSHNFVLKELFDYTLLNEKEYQYTYHILVHNWDRDAWPEDGLYKLYSYGDKTLYDQIFNSSLELVRKDPIFGYTKFNKAMVHIYEQFLESGILAKLEQINFETLITDVPNFITKFLRQHLKIKNNVYCSPPSLPNLFYNMFEMNPSYFPAIGATFPDLMTFPERFLNSIYVFGTRVMFWLFMGEQANVFKKYGFDLKTNDVFVHDSFVMIQYSPGFFYSFAHPPNFVLLNAISPKPARPIAQSSPKIEKFLLKHKKAIYFSQGTIVKIVDFDKVIGLFTHFKDYGFILSFKKGLMNDNMLKVFPENVLLVGWVNQNDLLGDSRIKAFITHGGTNSVSEALYHGIPIIVLGVTLDQINTASVVKKRNVGIVIHNSNDIKTEVLTKAMEEILVAEPQNEYINNVRKYAKLTKGNKEPRKEFQYWINYGMKYGYDHLLVKAYTEYSTIELYNYDVFLCLFLILYFLIKFFRMLCRLCCCKLQIEKKKIE